MVIDNPPEALVRTRDVCVGQDANFYLFSYGHPARFINGKTKKIQGIFAFFIRGIFGGNMIKAGSHVVLFAIPGIRPP